MNKLVSKTYDVMLVRNFTVQQFELYRNKNFRIAMVGLKAGFTQINRIVKRTGFLTKRE